MAKRKSKSGSLFGWRRRYRRYTAARRRAEGVPLHEAAQVRYLNYALSVITSRALPDVRDGLKRLQRRILYTVAAEPRPTPSTASAPRSWGT